MGFDQRAQAASDAAAAGRPPHRTPAELLEDYLRNLEADARTALLAWFSQMGEVLHDSTNRLHIDAVRAGSVRRHDGSVAVASPDRVRLSWTVADHNFSGEYYDPSSGHHRPGLTVEMHIDPDYSNPSWWLHPETNLAPTLEHVGSILREDKRRRALPIDRAAARRAGLKQATEYSRHDLSCPDCGRNLRTVTVISQRLFPDLTGCKGCRTGMYG